MGQRFFDEYIETGLQALFRDGAVSELRRAHENRLERHVPDGFFNAGEERDWRAHHTLNVAAELRLPVHQRSKPGTGNIAHHGRVHDADLSEPHDGTVYRSCLHACWNISFNPSVKGRGANLKSRTAAAISGA